MVVSEIYCYRKSMTFQFSEILSADRIRLFLRGATLADLVVLPSDIRPSNLLSADGLTYQDHARPLDVWGDPYIKEVPNEQYGSFAGTSHVPRYDVDLAPSVPKESLSNENCQMVLSDFGDAQLSGSGSKQPRKYRGGKMYQAPESLFFGIWDKPADIWSLANMVCPPC